MLTFMELWQGHKLFQRGIFRSEEVERIKQRTELESSDLNYFDEIK